MILLLGRRTKAKSVTLKLTCAVHKSVNSRLPGPTLKAEMLVPVGD